MKFDAAALFGSGAFEHFMNLDRVLFREHLPPEQREAALEPKVWLARRGWKNEKSIFAGGDWIMPGPAHQRLDFDMNGALANEFINTVVSRLLNVKPAGHFRLDFKPQPRERFTFVPTIWCEKEEWQQLPKALLHSYLKPHENAWRWFARHVLATANEPPILEHTLRKPQSTGGDQ